MSKELTERFESDCLDCGFYYASIPDEGVIILRSSDRHYLETSDGDKIDILSAVPSYEEYKELTQKVGRLELDSEAQDQVIKRLQEQINEANEIIDNFRTYDFTVDDERAEEYQVKYGIVGEKIYKNKKPSKEFERWRKKITKSLENKLKSGVKNNG